MVNPTQEEMENRWCVIASATFEGVYDLLGKAQVIADPSESNFVFRFDSYYGSQVSGFGYRPILYYFHPDHRDEAVAAVESKDLRKIRRFLKLRCFDVERHNRRSKKSERKPVPPHPLKDCLILQELLCK